MPTIKHLVFEGGGVKGIAYAGALTRLMELGHLDAVEHAAGSSAGALVALLVALGCTPDEAQDGLLQFKFNEIRDYGGITKIFSSYGAHRGDALLAWVTNMIEKKLSGPLQKLYGKPIKAPTFDDLRALVASQKTFHATAFRDVHMYAVDVNIGRPVLFSYYNEKTRHIPLATAVRASMAIPVFFTASQVDLGDEGVHTFVDGGLVDNYPVHLFDNGCRNPETLGLRVDSADEIAWYQQLLAKPVPVGGLRDYLGRIASIAMSAQGRHQSAENFRTIYIDTLGVGTTEFTLSDTTVRALLESGRNAASRFFQNWTENIRLGDYPPAVKSEYRLAKLDRQKLYSLASKIGFAKNKDYPVIQWVFTFPPNAYFDWEVKLGKYVNRLRQQAGMLSVQLCELMPDCRVVPSAQKGLMIIAQVTPAILTEFERWRVKQLSEQDKVLDHLIGGGDYTVFTSHQAQTGLAWLQIKPPNDDQRRALLQAASDGNYEQVSKLLHQGVSAHCRNEEQKTLLHLAVSAQQLALVKLVYQHDVGSLQMKDHRGLTPLHLAVWDRSPLPILEFLLCAGSDYDARDAMGRTPLMLAIRSGNLAAVERLLTCGAKLEICNRFGETAHDLAIDLHDKLIGDLAKIDQFDGQFNSLTAKVQDSKQIVEALGRHAAPAVEESYTLN